MFVRSELVNNTSRKYELLSLVVEGLGFDLVKIELSEENNCTLQIMIDKVGDDRVSVNDCSLVSREVAKVLDLHQPIGRSYVLEVSSPGVDRPLISVEDYEEYAGFGVRINMKGMHLGRRKFKGILMGLEGKNVKIKIGEEVFLLLYSNIKSAKLLLTPELLEPVVRV